MRRRLNAIQCICSLNPSPIVLMLLYTFKESCMSLRLSALIVVAAAFSGCAVMEQNHFPQTQDKVPVKEIVAFSEAYPNDSITESSEQKMFDGSVHYKFAIKDSKGKERMAAFAADGKEIKNP